MPVPANIAGHADFAIGMLAAPRVDIGLDRALQHLRWGGFAEQVHIFAEPGLEDGRWPGTTWHPNAVKQGVVRNWIGALTWLAGNTQAGHLLLVEDDVDYCRGAARILRAGIEQSADYGVISLYLATRFAHHHEAAYGWRSHAYDERTFGALAICFRRGGGILDLLASEELAERVRVSGDHPAGACSHDELIFRFFRERGCPCLTHRPSLADHLGTSSTLGHADGPHRRGLDFRRDLERSP